LPAWEALVIDLLIRGLIGGVFVSTFALLADVLTPKSFAGLFGAAPSVALATLLLAVHSEGRPYAALEARSMLPGGIAFALYAYCVTVALARWPRRVLTAVSVLLLLWCAAAASLWTVCCR
jgi:hypothetical protein